MPLEIGNDGFLNLQIHGSSCASRAGDLVLAGTRSSKFHPAGDVDFDPLSAFFYKPCSRLRRGASKTCDPAVSVEIEPESGILQI
jgi:hypothetical protein